MKSKEGTLRSNLYWNTLLPIFAQGLCFVNSILTARILMPKDFGIMCIAMMVIGYANLFTNFGFNQAIIQKRITNVRDVNSLFTLGLAMSISVGAITLLFANDIAVFFNLEDSEKVIKIMSLVFLITAFSVIPDAILKRDMNFKIVSIIGVFQAVFVSVLTLTLAIAGLGYWSLVYGQLVPLTISTIVLCNKAHWRPMLCYDHSLTKKVMGFSFWNYIRGQLNFVCGHTDKFIIGKFMGPVQLGYYDKAASVADQPQSTINMNINAVFFSSFSYNKENLSRLQEQLKKSLCLIGIINLPIYLGLIAIAPYFVNVLLGPKWLQMIVPLQIISLGCICNSFTSLAANLNVAIGKYSEHTVRLLLIAICFIISTIILSRYGINGVACSLLIFNVLKILFLLGLSLKELHLRWLDYASAILPSLIASLFMFLNVSLASIFWLVDYNFINMIVIILIGIIIYILYFIVIDRSKITYDFKKAIIADLRKLVAKFSLTRVGK